ncbi:MAG: hypothetical protein JO172_01815 [Hyphomicrobiales bacterium]|nr:hypothetical protein [Hyphomicrobiales bacterium]
MSDPITTLHYAPNGNIVNNSYAPGAVGFNLADISSAGELPSLPAGVEALAWFGMTSGVTDSFKAAVNSYIGAKNLFGIYLADEPGGSTTIAANLKTESDYIHATLPGVKTFMVEQNLGSNESPSYYQFYNPSNTHIDLFGLDPYPVQINVNNNLDYGIIAKAVSAAEAIGISQQQIVPIYQAFGGGGYPTYILPTAAQEQSILSTWGAIIPTPVFDYAYSWGVQVSDTALVTDPALQQVFAVHNALTASPPTSPPPPVAATLVSIAASGQGIDTSTGKGDLDAGKTVTLTVNFSAPVTVAGSPSLALDDGGSASFTSGSGTSALNFTYTVAPNQNTPALTVSSLDLPAGATILDASSNSAGLTRAQNYKLAGPLQIDTTPPVVTISNMDTVTSQPTQTLAGTVDVADANTTVLVFDGSTQVASTTPQSDGSWSAGVTLANGANVFTARDTDAAGNIGTSNSVTYTLNATAPAAAAVTSITTSGSGVTNGNGDLDAGNTVTLSVYFSEPVTVTGSPSLALNDGGNASYVGGSNSDVLTFTYTVSPGENTPDLTISSLNLTGATIVDASSNSADVTGAKNYNPAGILQIDTTAPTISINNIASSNIVTQSSAISGFSISGATVGAEDGQTVSVAILNSANVAVQSFITTDQGNAWSVPVSPSQASALADGSYTVTANVLDLAGNPAPQASLPITVDEEKSSEAPNLSVANASLKVSPNHSVALGIRATPSDADDRISVKISGVPSY